MAGSSPALRAYAATHIDENCEDLTGFHENELFYNCTFRNLKGLTLKDCVLTKSRFLTDCVEDALGFTFTVGDCNTFSDVEYSPTLVELFLVMILKTSGNSEIRHKLLTVLGSDRVRELLIKFGRLDVR